MPFLAGSFEGPSENNLSHSTTALLRRSHRQCLLDVFDILLQYISEGYELATISSKAARNGSFRRTSLRMNAPYMRFPLYISLTQGISAEKD